MLHYFFSLMISHVLFCLTACCDILSMVCPVLQRLQQIITDAWHCSCTNSNVFMSNVTNIHLLLENLQIKDEQTITFTLYLTLKSWCIVSYPCSEKKPSPVGKCNDQNLWFKKTLSYQLLHQRFIEVHNMRLQKRNESKVNLKDSISKFNYSYLGCHRNVQPSVLGNKDTNYLNIQDKKYGASINTSQFCVRSLIGLRSSAKPW